MAADSKIQWTDHTINFWWGCTKIAPGCANCYAEAWSKRYGLKLWGPGSVRKRIKGAIPLAHKLNRQAEQEGVRFKVFTCSMADMFEDFGGRCVNEKAEFVCEGLEGLRYEAFECIDSTPNLDWQILTKRPENTLRMWPQDTCYRIASEDGLSQSGYGPRARSNVWLGTSISDQSTADKAVPELLKCRDLAPVLFLSAEPLLGDIYLEEYLWSTLGGDPAYVDWVIVGGESGPSARPCSLDWIHGLKDQCEAAGVPCFIKQLGAYPLNYSGQRLRYEDAKGGDLDTWPEALRVRQFPEPANA